MLNIHLDPHGPRPRIDRLAVRATSPVKVRPGMLLAVICTRTPAFISSPAALCGTSTNTRIGVSWLSRYRSVLPLALPAVTRLPISTRRSVTVPSKGAVTCLNCAIAVKRSTRA